MVLGGCELNPVCCLWAWLWAWLFVLGRRVELGFRVRAVAVVRQQGRIQNPVLLLWVDPGLLPWVDPGPS